MRTLPNIAWDAEAHEMRKDLKGRKFKIEIFIIALIVISILTALSLLAAWGRDEGTLEANDGVIWNLLADSFNFFRLPTHGLFWQSIAENASSLFIPTLMINVIFWTIAVERMITIGTRIIKHRRLKSNVR
jgi:hypothetical protein